MTSHLRVCRQMASWHRGGLRLGRSHQLKCFYVTAFSSTWNWIEMRSQRSRLDWWYCCSVWERGLADACAWKLLAWVQGGGQKEKENRKLKCLHSIYVPVSNANATSLNQHWNLNRQFAGMELQLILKSVNWLMFNCKLNIFGFIEINCTWTMDLATLKWSAGLFWSSNFEPLPASICPSIFFNL